MLELSVKIKMWRCKEWWDLVSVRVKKNNQNTEELTDRAKSRKTWTKDRT